MKAADYDFFLPDGFIAEYPEEKRDAARLMVLGRDVSPAHRRFSDLPDYLQPGDLIILNDSKVLPSRLQVRAASGSILEILLVKETDAGLWDILCRGNYTGPVLLPDESSAEMEDGRLIRFSDGRRVSELLWKHGSMPLPPYIRRPADANDRVRYQTVYAREEGSIAAPTAGLHFTNDLFARIAVRSVRVRFITLHVGTGTFRPVRTEEIEDHRMDEELFSFDADLLDEIAETKRTGGRVITVGTTTTRTIEGYLSGRCRIFSQAGTIRGATDIFIHEGHTFRGPDMLITNFHLPRSTPLMLAAAFAGRRELLDAYAEAIRAGYRFFSYGDAMLVAGK